MLHGFTTMRQKIGALGPARLPRRLLRLRGGELAPVRVAPRRVLERARDGGPPKHYQDVRGVPARSAAGAHDSKPSSIPCIGCLEGKAHQPHHSRVPHKPNLEPGDVIHCDIKTNLPTSYNGKKYMIHFTDERSRHTYTYAIARKSHAVHAFRLFLWGPRMGI